MKKKLSSLELNAVKINNIYQSSQVNPNYSSSNLSKINQNGNPFYSHNGSTVSINSIPSTPYDDFGSPSPPLMSHPSSYISLKNSYLLSPPYSETTSPELKPHYNDTGRDQDHDVEIGLGIRIDSEDNSNSSTTIAATCVSRLKSILPPINYKICSLCLAWYFCSIISSNSIKLVLNNFKYPVTLTQFQFLINALLSLLVLSIAESGVGQKLIPRETLPENTSFSSFLRPNKYVIAATVPMGCFQFIGHLTSHKATSIIPVSLVHTIKALSPIMTVLIYRFAFKKQYKKQTYIILLPLIFGIMMTCYKPNNKVNAASSGYLSGLIFAFISMVIFVSQNIFAKAKLSPTTSATKLDNLTILCYCSIVGFVLTSPIYLASEVFNQKVSLKQLDLTVISLVLINGLSHFIQSLLAFQILRLLSPIDYSIANILKRIFIILISFVWESKQFTSLQTCGLALTLFGLYCYDRWGTQRSKVL
ncbi:uncharacterized protein LODBEIA_P43400 [Lodderomyces beijingensis]|uniref:Sugar phosphate transporter domain-containing protein n=1 Tax=Lodderomyces beijingensis TaxID=1775926 RepID=A0ABP0ZSN5_9ASCO